MKNIYTLFVALIITGSLMAQAPQSFKYQAVARDAGGDVVAGQAVGMQISILQGSTSGTSVYTETFTPGTNEFGLINLNIGTGTVVSGDFTSIDWSADTYYIKVEMDITGGTTYEEYGTSQLLSVPYAMHAKTAANIFSGSYIDLTNKPDIIDSINSVIDTTTQFVRTEVDGDITNEIQDLSNVLVQGTDAGSNNITNLATPVNDQDAATKAYVDALLDRISELESLTTTLKDYDDNLYATVKIGDQIWMAENLKTTHYANGDAIPDGTGTGDISGETDPEYWFAHNDDLNNIYTYGRLYTWYTITDSRNVCPDGWHVPSDAEWTTLDTYLGGSSVAGGKMKETGTTHWNNPNTGATNESGFTALPGGERHYNGAFGYIGEGGFWWSSTENLATDAYGWLLYNFVADIYSDFYDKKMGFSVRCLRD